MKNLWARNYESNGFFVHADAKSGQTCSDYRMDNLLASDNRSYGLFAKNCLGGKMINSTGYHQGDSAFYVGETPCDKPTWTNHGIPPPALPEEAEVDAAEERQGLRKRARLLGHQLEVRRIVESAFYNNGAGIVPNTLDSEGFEPNGWNVFEHNDVFWNNYNYFLAATSFKTVSPGLGQVASATVNYPTGVGFVLYGGDGNVVRQNNVFGNYKWGIAVLLGPRRSLRRQPGRRRQEHQQPDRRKHDGPRRRRPQRRIRLLERRHRRRQLLGGQHRQPDLRAGQRQSALEPDLPPACPQSKVLADQVRSLNITSGLQINLGEESDPSDDPRLRRVDPAPEPAVHLGEAGRRAPGVQELHAGRGRRPAGRSGLQMNRRAAVRLCTLLATCLAAVALVGVTAAPAKAPRPKPVTVVSVNDFYFGPSSVTIKKGGSVKWVWASTNT